MRMTIIRDDNVVGINGQFRKVDLTGFPPDVRAVQWNETTGHIEYDDGSNVEIDGISGFQPFIDQWTRNAPPMPRPPTTQERVAAAHARINASYESAILQIVGSYPAHEISSWDKQETEARAWVADNTAATPWLDGAATARGIPKAELVAKVIAQADALAPVHGALSGKRQYLRDRINALVNPTQEQLNAIQW